MIAHLLGYSPGLACFNRQASQARGRDESAFLTLTLPQTRNPIARCGRRAAARGGEQRGRRGAFQPGTAAQQLDVLTALADARSAGQPLSRDQGCAAREDFFFLVKCESIYDVRFYVQARSVFLQQHEAVGCANSVVTAGMWRSCGATGSRCAAAHASSLCPARPRRRRRRLPMAAQAPCLQHTAAPR